MNLVLVILFLFVASFAYGAISAAPWVPLRQRDVERLIKLAQPQPGEMLYDLGCGDGRILLSAVKKFNLKAKGFEVAIVPYLITKAKIFFTGSKQNTFVKLESFWQTDLNEADIVVCFLTPPAMSRLEKKLAQELKPGARFISYAFPLPSIEPTVVDKPFNKDLSIYLYTKIVQPVG